MSRILPPADAAVVSPVLPPVPSPRLRAPALAQPFHVVLVEPEIPPNTGNIARLCAATACKLHLVGKLGFRIDDQAVRRAGLDYWPLVQVRHHADFVAFCAVFGAESPAGKLHLFSATSELSYLAAGFAAGDALIFGKESVGLSDELLGAYPGRDRAIPTLGPVRSLNLANSVSIVLFEALRSIGALDATFRG
jgi:tRNA (cytidine/uridine-2'-O-)-methyltransferase